MTADATAKLDDIQADPHVNLAYFKRQTSEWVSISGLATISHDRERIRELWEPDWKIWFSQQGDPRHGTADDPRMVLLGVEIHGAVYFEVDKPKPVVLYELAKGWLTGQEPDIGETHAVGRTRRRGER